MFEMLRIVNKPFADLLKIFYVAMLLPKCLNLTSLFIMRHCYVFQVDLADIKTRYQQLYGRSLYEAVSSQVRGDYKPLLLAVIDK